jgi:hypothetical protein
VLLTDAKSVYDALSKPTSTAVAAKDKRTAIDLAIIRNDLQRSNSLVRWIEGTVQLADSLTKDMQPDLFRATMRRGDYVIADEAQPLQYRETERARRLASRVKGNKHIHTLYCT